ncbi:MAG TPA: DUF3043 domain-containing protein [Streptosporangiaceae bacterium]|nr:DUF3043 domain-containing protein [Streptosporangiaceae bacterium]
MFRRSRTGTEDGPGQDAVNGSAAPEADESAAQSHAVTAGKGRPTPKRSEAERRRRQPYTAPKDRKEAAKAGRDRQRSDRTRRMEAVRRGEEWAMPPRDRGPVKALARDYVDSKRRISEYYMYGLLVLLVLLLVVPLFTHATITQTLVPPLVLAAVLIMGVEGIFIGRKVKSLAAERLPGESTRGLALYSAMRALQIRKLRVPKPRVKPGGSF